MLDASPGCYSFRVSQHKKICKKKKKDMPHPFSGLLFPGAPPVARGFQALFVSIGPEVGARGQFELRTEGFGDAEGQVSKSPPFCPSGNSDRGSSMQGAFTACFP